MKAHIDADTTLFVILAAGRGTRLGRALPKPLTQLTDGRSIMQRQIEGIRSVTPSAKIVVAVGFRAKKIMKTFHDVAYVYNESFAETNTSKSLLRLLRATGDSSVVWMNGDVVYDPAVLERLAPSIRDGVSCVAVNTAATADEEIKYTLDADGFISQLSKKVTPAEGEAVGINFVSAADKPALMKYLDTVGDQDYFERGMELAIAAGTKFRPVDISDLFAVEVDFQGDLDTANKQLDGLASRALAR